MLVSWPSKGMTLLTWQRLKNGDCNVGKGNPELLLAFQKDGQLPREENYQMGKTRVEAI